WTPCPKPVYHCHLMQWFTPGCQQITSRGLSTCLGSPEVHQSILNRNPVMYMTFVPRLPLSMSRHSTQQ
ncbi:hypothetical protein ATANTOWER_008594, partial [Ataeniobius toweri]|nr:hypothetical protein [Ataeniobius toweri]